MIFLSTQPVGHLLGIALTLAKEMRPLCVLLGFSMLEIVIEIEGVRTASAFVAAKKMKIKITTRKQENGKIRICKIKGNVANPRSVSIK